MARDDWHVNVFRAAMYTEEDGYIDDPSVKEKVKEAVEAAIDLGIYVIIDWHILYDGNPNEHKEEAKAFFQEMAPYTDIIRMSSMRLPTSRTAMSAGPAM